MVNMMGKCEYCGTEIGVMAVTQAEANELASEKCSCSGVAKAKKKTAMKIRLSSLIGPACIEKGFNPVDKVVYDAIETVGLMVVDGLMQKVTFNVDGTTITITPGKKIKVTRKYTYEQTGEVE